MLEHIVSFVKKVKPAAKAVEESEGFNYLFIMAQIALETGWLERVSKDCDTGEDSKNLFNIKGKYQGESVRIKTKEYFEDKDGNGKLDVEVIYDEFRKYPSYEHSIQDWIRLLKTPRYQKAYEVRSDLRQLAQKIYECGYATDPDYTNKIVTIANIIRSYEMIIEVKKSDDPIHVVAPGDTLWNISKRYRVPMEDIIRLNKLRSPDHIYPGQKLVISRRIHTIQKGETLSQIAARYNVTVEAIVNENGIANPDRIYPGEDLVIPS